MKDLIRKFIPKTVLNSYHKKMALLANLIYGKPSEKLIVIGVTGTNGKTTTVNLISKILEEAGFKTGVASTAVFKIAEMEWLNDKKMTMLGRFALQRMIAKMVQAGCKYAIIETSSQGIEQFRHLGIHYDICIFTNLTPEHIEAHGGFDNYKKAKLKLFEKLKNDPVKNIDGVKIKKIIIANIDDENAKSFLDFDIDEKVGYGIKGKEANTNLISDGAVIKAKKIEFAESGIAFMAEAIKFNLKLFGEFNVYNSLCAISLAKSQGIDMECCRSALEKIESIPGRMEFINEGQDFKVIVDYAPEPESLKQCFLTIKKHGLVKEGRRIIHVLGSCGGGRDISRRPVMGSISAANSQMAIITDEDPYNDDPKVIIEQVAQGAVSAGMVLGKNLFKIQDRRMAIEKALKEAKNDDLVLLTGKGSEQAICLSHGRKLPWDEREVSRSILTNLAK